MPSNFDWRTEDENSWEVAPTVDVAAPQIRRRWPSVFLIIGLLTLGGLVVYRQVRQRVEAATAAVEADVQAADALVQRAAAQGDRELFISLVSGRDPLWTDAQKELLEQGLLFDRRPLGLSLKTPSERPGAATTVEVVVSPNLQAAELQAVQTFAIDVGNGLTETVSLQRTSLYRRSHARWLFAPPLAEFWGEWLTSEQPRLTVTYPARDAEIGRRLALDLEAKLGELCDNLAGLACPDYVHLFLTTDPQSLLDLADPLRRLTATTNVALPTPTLVGLPLDEASYQALVRAYARHLLGPVIAVVTSEWSCCHEHPLFIQALLDWQLSQLGVQPWPLTAADYEAIAERPFSLGSVGLAWSTALTETAAVQEQQRPVLAVVDFLQQQAPSVSVAAMQRELSVSQSYWDWLQKWLEGSGFLARDNFARADLERAWLRHVSQAAQTPPPIPLPGQSLQLLCQPVADSSSAFDLYRYDPATNSWTNELPGRAFTFLAGRQDDQGVILEELIDVDSLTLQGATVSLATGASDQKRVVLWQEGREVVAFAGPARSGNVSPVNWADPTGRRLVLYQRGEATGPLSFLYLDLGQCTTAGCAQNTAAGFPLWSPDGQNTLLWTDSGIGLLLGDSEGAPLDMIAPGFAPFWLDNDRYGYVYEGPGLSHLVQQVRVANKSDNQTKLFLPIDELMATFAAGEQPAELSIEYLAANPADRQQLIVAATNLDEVEPESYLFGVKWTLEAAGPSTLPIFQEATLLLQVDDHFASYPPFQFSPDGRWLTLVTDTWRHPSRLLYLLDVTTGEARTYNSPRPYPRYDWSADGRWLARADSGFLQLIAPADDYQKLIVYDFADCPAVAWSE